MWWDLQITIWGAVKELGWNTVPWPRVFWFARTPWLPRFVLFLIYLDIAEHLWVILSEGGADVEGGSEKYFNGKINFRTELMEGRLQSILLCNLATKGGNGIINTLPKWLLFCLIMGFAIDRLIEFNGEKEEEGHWRSRKQSPWEDDSDTKDS